MADGWIMAHRKLAESELWLGEPFSRGQAWLDLIFLANWKPGFVRVRGQRVDLQRGQLTGSLKFLSERWTWSRGKVARFLSELEMDTQIGQQKNNVTNVITITNYDEYQSTGTQAGKQTGRRQVSKRSADGDADGAQTGTHTNKNKKVKKKKEGARAFVEPTVGEVGAYCIERGNSVDPQQFVDHYTANGWVQGRGKPIKDWKAAVRTWERNGVRSGPANDETTCRVPTDEELANWTPTG